MAGSQEVKAGQGAEAQTLVAPFEKASDRCDPAEAESASAGAAAKVLIFGSDHAGGHGTEWVACPWGTTGFTHPILLLDTDLP